MMVKGLHCLKKDTGREKGSNQVTQNVSYCILLIFDAVKYVQKASSLTSFTYATTVERGNSPSNSCS